MRRLFVAGLLMALIFGLWGGAVLSVKANPAAPAQTLGQSKQFIKRLAAGGPGLTFVVNTTGDSVDTAPGNGLCADQAGDCSLRAAVMEANALLGQDVVTLPKGTYELTLPGSGEDASAAGDLDVLDSLVLIGSGPGGTEILCSDTWTEYCIEASKNTSIHGVLISGRGILTGVSELEMSNCEVRGGSLVVMYSEVAITGCRFYYGGGIESSGGQIVLQNVTVDANYMAPAGIHTIMGNLEIYNSTIANNMDISASTGFAGISGGVSSLRIVNSTIGGNRGVLGSGISFDESNLIILNSTIVDNEGLTSGLIVGAQSEARISNTILEGCLTPFKGKVTSDGYNLVGSTAGCSITAATGDRFGLDPQIIPVLSDNGGPTLTYSLRATSPAIDAGDPAGCKDLNGLALSYDQRLYPRNQDGKAGGRPPAILDR